MESIERLLISPVKELLGKISLDIELSLAIFGAAAVAVFFLLSLIFAAASSNNKFKKKLVGITEFIGSGDQITEENVEGLHDRFEKDMPESVKKNWGCFLEQRDGYPSDYITQRDTFENIKPAKAPKAFFGLFSALVIVFTIWLTYFICKGASLSTIKLEDFTDNLLLLASIIAAFCAPLIVYVILRLILNAVCSSQLKKTKKAFAEFQKALDEKVLVYSEPADEFITDNIYEINAEIEEILANKLNKREIIEIVSVPKIEEKAPVAVEEPVAAEAPVAAEKPVIAEEPVVAVPAGKVYTEKVYAEVEKLAEDEPFIPEEPLAEVAAAEAPAETEEEKISQITSLVYIIESLSKDPDTTGEDVKQVADILFAELQKPGRDEIDVQVIIECFQYLQDISPYYGVSLFKD